MNMDGTSSRSLELELSDAELLIGGTTKMNTRKIPTLILAVCLAVLPAGCGAAPPDPALMQTELGALTVPDQVQVIGLGEASHGVKEYQQLKAEVFQVLVENYGCRTFVLEGDFGNALTVDDYIHGGEGTAEEAAGRIGFRIYRTAEMASLLDWMRTYNETAPKGDDLHFYGMDMQSADNSKAYLFRIFEQIDPDLCASWEETFAFLNDDDMFDISTDTFAQGLPEAEKLIRQVEQEEERITETFGAETFAFARECAVSIYNCCDIRKSDSDYNDVRDRHMTEKVLWFLEHTDSSPIFISGHNGHIGRSNFTAYYDCLGKRLAEELGDRYFAIGTDARITAFNSQTDEGFSEKRTENKNDLNALAGKTENGWYYIDFSSVSEDSRWHKLLSKKQRLTTLNVGSITFLKTFCTSKIVPLDTFDAMIVYDAVTPTSISQ